MDCIFAHKFVMKALTSAMGSIFAFVSLMIMTRYVGDEYGLMMWGWALIGTFNTLTDLGFSAAHIKAVSQGNNQNVCMSTYLTIKVILCTLLCAITAFYLILFNTEDLSGERMWILLSFLGYYLVYDFTWVLITTFDGRLDAGRSSVIQTVDAFVKALFLALFAIFGASASLLSTAYLIGIISSLIVAIWMARGLGLKIVRPELMRVYADFAKPLAVGTTLVLCVSLVDKLVIEYFCGSLDVGYYTSAMGLVYAATALGLALNNVLLPKFSELVKNKDVEKIEEVLWSSQRYISMALIPCVIFVFVFGNEIALMLLGASYIGAGDALSILAITIYLNILIGIMTQLLYSTNNTKEYRNATIIYASLTMGLFLLLTPESIGGIKLAGLGITGTSLGMSIGCFIFLLILLLLVKRTSGIVPIFKDVYKHIIAGVLALTFTYFMQYYLDPQGLFTLILIGLASIAFYLCILFIVRGLTKQDILFVLDSVNPKGIYDSAMEERKK